MRKAAALAVAFTLVACGAGRSADADGERAGDVRLAAEHLRRDHPSLFHDLSSVRFEEVVDDLAGRADAIDEDELLVGLMRLAALPGVRDVHTGIFPLDPSHRRVLHPVFVGEPSGGSPNNYGDAQPTLLPASGVTLHVAGIYWQMSTPDDLRVTIEPQRPVGLTPVDFFAGRDPVLAAAVDTVVAPRVLAAPKPRFSYDRSRPLDLRLGETQTQAGVVRQALTFDAGFGRKAGSWIHPDRGGPWPVVLFSPGFGQDVREQLPDAERLAGRGIASLLVAPPQRLLRCNAVADVRTYSNYVVGRRRALDLLAQLPGADATRVAAVGFSFGSAVTATLAAVDHRLRGAVIQSGRAHLSVPIGRECRYLGAKRQRAFTRAYSIIDPVRYVARAAPAALLFQNGTQDPISPRRDVEAYVRAAGSPKELRWYEAAHELNEQARTERDAWLVELLR